MSAAATIECGLPQDDTKAYRRCLGQFGTGVTVVTACHGPSIAGMTVNSFASVSLDPPLVLWSAKKKSPSFAVFAEAAAFAINILARDQSALSTHFGQSGENKFEGVSWTEGVSGTPLLDGCVATIECRTAKRVDGGDHLILVGEVQWFKNHQRDPLLFVQGRYSAAADLTDAAAGLASHRTEQVVPLNEFFTSLCHRSFGVLSEALEVDRKAEGLTLMQSRLMSGIEAYVGTSLSQLVPELFLGENAAHAALDELVDLGFVQVGPSGELTLTDKGALKNRALLARVRDTESRILSGMPKVDVAAAKRVLMALATRTHLGN